LSSRQLKLYIDFYKKFCYNIYRKNVKKIIIKMVVKFMANLFAAHEAWDRYCIKNNIRDPFKALEDLRDEYTEYHHHPEKGLFSGEIIIHDMTEEQKIREIQLKKERDEYIKDRELFVGQFLLKNYGYNELSNFAQSHHYEFNGKLQEWFQTVKPCEGKDGQCQIFCPIFQECNKN
jgi:hypothetical protein